MPKPPIAPGVRKAMIVEAASEKKGKPGLAARLAEAFGVSEVQTRAFLAREKAGIDDIRGQISEGFLMLAGQAAARISEKLSSDEAMADTPLRDLAMTAEKLTNAAVTAQEGHRPIVNLNIVEARGMKAELDAIDRKMREAKAARGRVVVEA